LNWEKGCTELVNKLNISWQPFHVKVRTASGSTQNILGRITVPITFKNTTVNMNIFLCPTLEQELDLVVDFWKSFDVEPEVFGIEEIPAEIEVDKPPKKAEPEQH